MLKRTAITSILLLSLAACGQKTASDMTYEEHQNHLNKIAAEYEGDPVKINRANNASDMQMNESATYKIIEGIWTFDYTGPESAMIIKQSLTDAGFEIVDIKTHGPSRYIAGKHILSEVYGELIAGMTYQVRPGTIDVKLSMKSQPDFSQEMAERLASEIRQSIVGQIKGDILPPQGSNRYAPNFERHRQAPQTRGYAPNYRESRQPHRGQYNPSLSGEVYDPYGW
jgi:hypothetical protein